MAKTPTKGEASVAGRALKTGEATKKEIRSMAGQIEAARKAELKKKK